MKVLPDTDIILDLLLARQGFAGDAVALFGAHDRGEIEGFISSSAINARLAAIVTRNLSDYKNSPLPVYSSADFLALLAAT
jgi:hypothetical protein